METDLDYLAHLTSESARFAEVLRAATPQARVPCCPDWNADDLLWHLAEVQWFWGTIVREDIDAKRAEALKPGRPADRAGLLAFFHSASRDLSEVLAKTSASTQRWTWADDQTVGFIRRRQAHEALIHRVDAEMTAGQRGPLDPRLSADGVDEALRIMYGGDLPPWGTFTPVSASRLQVLAADTGDSWLVSMGRFTGTDPSDQVSYDEPGIHVSGGAPGSGTPGNDLGDGVTASITGRAADLDCWLWHRPPAGQLERAGEADLLARFESVIAPGIS